MQLLRRRRRHGGQSTLEWVIGAAIILSTLVTAVLEWNHGLASRIGELVKEISAR